MVVIVAVVGFLGLHPEQGSTALGGAEHFPAATAEQIVDIPVPCGAEFFILHCRLLVCRVGQI